jgi:hypothetical protein
MPSLRASKLSPELTRLHYHFELLQGARAVGKARPGGEYHVEELSRVDNGAKGQFLFYGAFTGSSLGTTFHLCLTKRCHKAKWHWERAFCHVTIHG